MKRNYLMPEMDVVCVEVEAGFQATNLVDKSMSANGFGQGGEQSADE